MPGARGWTGAAAAAMAALDAAVGSGSTTLFDVAPSTAAVGSMSPCAATGTDLASGGAPDAAPDWEAAATGKGAVADATAGAVLGDCGGGGGGGAAAGLAFGSTCCGSGAC